MEVSKIRYAKDRHLSYSQINTYTRCPYLWGLQYINGLKPKGGTPALMVGRALHETLSRYATWHMETGNESLDVLMGLWQTVTEDVDITEAPLAFEFYTDWQARLKELFVSPNFNFSKAIAMEWKKSVDYGEGITVVSVLDRVDKLGEGQYRIVDYKKGGFQTEARLADNLQLRMYAAALWLMWGDDIKSLSVATHILETDDFVEVQITLAEVEETIQYVNSIGKRMFSDSKCQANPGKACVMYGGCWGAHACKEHHQTAIVTKDATLDLATASDSELGRWYTGVEYLRTMIQGAMKTRLSTGTSEIIFAGNKFWLKPATKRTVNPKVLHTMLNEFSPYGFTPAVAMNLDFRSLQKNLKATEATIMDDVRLGIGERNALVQALCEMRDDLYVEETSGQRFTSETIKEDD